MSTKTYTENPDEQTMLARREMIGLDGDVWDDPVHLVPRILVSHRRTGVPEDALTSAVRASAEMWNLRVAGSVGDGAADAVVIALDMPTPQGRRLIVFNKSRRSLIFFFLFLTTSTGAN
jgi:hypothetical protein